ncbi:TIGR04222 domain-containing membrane protein [Kitasatospora sp. NPDC085895]|uniref:TIGR04222 domain-containing membrane protein n=1 Tax=Kitasatospora sp. NPDC085895 TaxID=3155057 RepID=UPI00344CF013
MRVRRAVVAWRSLTVVTRAPGRELSLYEAAWLYAGPTHVVEVCLAGMLWSGRLTVTGSTLRIAASVPRDSVEAAVVDACKRSPDASAWETVERVARSAPVRALGEHLAEQNLIAPPGALRALTTARETASGLASSVPIVMGILIIVALFTGEPAWAVVGAAATVIASTVLGVASRKRPHLPPDGITDYGRQFLDALPDEWIPRTATPDATSGHAARLGRCARGLLRPDEEPRKLRAALTPPPSPPPSEVNDWAGMGI